MNISQVSLRKGSLHDAERIAVLVNSAYRGNSSRHGWTTEADFIGGQRTDTSEIEEILSTDNQWILLAVSNEEIIGCVHLEKRDANVCYYGMLVVKPELQAQGLGKRLIMEAERLASHQLACTIMQMHVISIRNELIAWYELRGYRRTDERHPFPYGNERFGIPLRDDLEFIVFVKELKVS